MVTKQTFETRRVRIVLHIHSPAVLNKVFVISAQTSSVLIYLYTVTDIRMGQLILLVSDFFGSSKHAGSMLFWTSLGMLPDPPGIKM